MVLWKGFLYDFFVVLIGLVEAGNTKTQAAYLKDQCFNFFSLFGVGWVFVVLGLVLGFPFTNSALGQ